MSKNTDPMAITAKLNRGLSEDIGNDIKRLRISRGLDLGQMAELVGATVEMLEQIEQGEYDLNISELRLISIALRAPVNINMLALEEIDYQGQEDL